MVNRGDIVEEISDVFERHQMDVPDALIALADTVVSIHLTHSPEPTSRKNLMHALEIFNAHVLLTFADFMASDFARDDEEPAEATPVRPI